MKNPREFMDCSRKLSLRWFLLLGVVDTAQTGQTMRTGSNWNQKSFVDVLCVIEIRVRK